MSEAAAHDLIGDSPRALFPTCSTIPPANNCIPILKVRNIHDTRDKIVLPPFLSNLFLCRHHQIHRMVNPLVLILIIGVILRVEWTIKEWSQLLNQGRNVWIGVRLLQGNSLPIHILNWDNRRTTAGQFYSHVSIDSHIQYSILFFVGIQVVVVLDRGVILPLSDRKNTVIFPCVLPISIHMEIMLALLAM